MDMDTRSPRRWLQFGLRTTLITTLLLGVGLGVWCNRAARLRKTLAALDALGVQVHWDVDTDPEVVYGMMEPPLTPGEFLFLGPEYFQAPTSVVVGEETPLEKLLPHLQALPSLRAIYVRGDAAAKTIHEGVPDVELFVIHRGRCGDMFLESLSGSANP